MEKKKFKVNLHLVFAIVIILIIVVIVRKFVGFGRTITREEIDAISVPGNPYLETSDYIIPNMFEDDGTFPKDDGKTTIVCFGNNLFSDDRNSDKNLCNMFAKETGATVYNCSIPGSFMTSYNETFYPESYPMDAFSFYWLTTVFTVDNDSIIDQAYKAIGNVPSDVKDAVSLLQSIDFETVDAIFIMYDGSDYLEGRGMYSDTNFTDPQQFTGAMAAGIQLIQQEFPWIRIITMSPTYAYGVDENGKYVSSEVQTYGQHFLSTYSNKQSEAAYELQVSFLDNMNGTIYEEIASDYLIDNIHINQKGRELLIPRMKDALERYTTIY